MAALLTAGRYTKQPQQPVPIDARWRAKRLRVAYVPNSLNPIDLAGPLHGADTSTTSTLSLGTPGRVWDFGAGSSTSRILLPSNSIVGTGGVTWLAVVRISSLAAARTIACGNASASGSLQWRVSTGGFMEMVSSGVSVLSTDTVALAANTWHVVACSISSQTPVVRSTFAQGGRITSNPVTATVTTTNGVGVIGDRYSASSQPFAGQIALFAAFDTLLSEGELAELTANPWGIFSSRSAGPWLFDEPAAGGAIVGTLSKTLGDLSTVAAGVLAISGVAPTALGTLTSQATGAVAITGTVGLTLGALTGAAVGSSGASGVVAATLGQMTSVASGVLPIAGAVVANLGAMNATAIGVLGSLTTGDLAKSLANVTASASGELRIAALVAATLAGAQVNGTARVDIAGALDVTLGQVVGSTSGTSGTDEQYPLAGLTQTYPLVGQRQTYPLE